MLNVFQFTIIFPVPFFAAINFSVQNDEQPETELEFVQAGCFEELNAEIDALQTDNENIRLKQ